MTDEPDAIIFRADALACPRTLGSKPLLSADGGRIVFISAHTLGIAPRVDGVSCNVFFYEVSTGTMHVAGGIRKETGVDLPSLSHDGRFLALSIIKTVLPYPRQGFPALLDTETGEFTESLIGVTGFTSFDSVISGDGTKVIISTQADLDPRVGNADHNLEIFVFDRTRKDFAQITDTLFGIGRSPGGCLP